MLMKLLRVLNGEPVFPPPVWLMRQAGRHTPEYRATRAQAGDFISLCLNPELAAEVTLQPIRRYGVDAAILFSDILIPPMALGQGLTFREGEGIRMPPLQHISELNPAQAASGYAPILETVRRVRAGLPAETALIGFCGGPLTVACYMLDGRGGNFPRTRQMAEQDAPLLAEVIDLLTNVSIGYLQGQIDAGADCVMIFESWGSIVTGDKFRHYVINPHRRIIDALRAKNPAIKIIGFPRLCGEMLGAYVSETGVSAVSLDTQVDPATAIAACPPGTVFQGNLDPDLLIEGGGRLRVETRRIVGAFRGRPHIFNLGHGITPEVSPDHVTAMMDAIRTA
jgi:uroporphyrinogen decarboxylase